MKYETAREVIISNTMLTDDEKTYRLRNIEKIRGQSTRYGNRVSSKRKEEFYAIWAK